MNEIIQTKLATPPRNNFTLPRIRLIKRLDDGLQRKLILVSAPAGWGKTTLVSQWVRDSRIPAGWLSLDPPDNDPSQFISYFLAALANSSEHFGNLASDSVPPSNLVNYASGHTMRTTFTAVINEATMLPGDTLLVLDDYHVINNPAIQEHLRFLLDHLPPKLHLALLTRSDPPLKLAQLRGRRQLLELRTAELSFTNDETDAYFAEAADKPLSPAAIDALHARTEGWPAGLQLAVQSLADRTNIEGFLQEFTGSHRFVLDYLVDEVLANQTSEMREFMLHTSILDRLSGPLCDAVTEQADSQKRLANLEQKNLFLLSLDDTRTWFRYHHLFSDLLRHRLEQQHGGLVPTLHHRASAWFEQNGWINDAIHHALRTADYPYAASLITTHALQILRKGQQFTLLRWIESIPEKVRVEQPNLCLWHAWVLLFVGRVMEHASPQPRNTSAISLANSTPAIVPRLSQARVI
jgi:LuxR family maltose regulon positive regulatory protein